MTVISSDSHTLALSEPLSCFALLSRPVPLPSLCSGGSQCLRFASCGSRS